MSKGGYDPSFVVGGYVPELCTNAKFGNGDFFVAELDESDGTIVKYSTDISVINNLEADHLDFFKNGLDDMIKTFLTHTQKAKTVILNNDNEGNLQLLKAIKDTNIADFGLNNAKYTAKNIEFLPNGSKFDFYKKENFIAKIELSILGKHNVYNALAVLSALCEANVDILPLIPHFKSFSGMGRRFEFIANAHEIDFYDDYAHHPSEIKATLESMKKSFKNRRIVAIFQPHRYTRLKGLWKDFKTAFVNCDKLFVTDIYEASEDPIEGITSQNFVKDFGEKASWEGGSITEAAQKILPQLKTGDVVVSLGAGSITHICPDMVELIQG